MLACPNESCPETKPTKGELLAHLLYGHGLGQYTAERLADRAVTVEPSAVAAAPPKPERACTNCGEPHDDPDHRRCDRCRSCPRCSAGPGGARHTVADCPKRTDGEPLPDSRRDPFGLDKAGIKTHVEPPAAPPAPIPPIKETPMPPKVKPPCKLCAKFAPDKCKRHGGKDRSTSNRGRGRTRGGSPSKPRAAAEPSVRKNGLPSFDAALAFLDTQIEQVEARLVKLKAARDGMAMLVEHAGA